MDENLYTYEPFEGLNHCDSMKYDPNKPRIKDILWDHYRWLVQMEMLGKVRSSVFDNYQRALLCNTIYLGFDAFVCPNCGNEMVFNRKCHSRFCNSCGVKYQKQLAIKAETMCVDTPHRHIVFTIPEDFRVFFRRDRKALNLLFIASRNTIAKVVNESLFRKYKRKLRHMGKVRNDKDNTYLFRNNKTAKRFGMISAIHTFGRDLKWNPHIHSLVPELVYDPVKDAIVPFHHFDFTSLRKTWQYELTRLMLEYFGDQFKPYVYKSYKNQKDGFYVYARYAKDDPQNSKDKSYSKDVAGCVNYMMRYASRPAMAESRLISYDKSSKIVRWYYNDHETEERKEVEEPAVELLKKMIIHIPDEGFRCIRYYGFYNNKEQDLLEHIYELMGEQKKKSRDLRARKIERRQKLQKIKYRTSVCDTFNRDVLLCKCGFLMRYAETYNPLEGIKNDREYRQKCIDEVFRMRIRRIPPGRRPSGASQNVSAQA